MKGIVGGLNLNLDSGFTFEQYSPPYLAPWVKRGVTVYVHKRLLRQQAHLLIVLCSWGQELVEGGVLL